jgi:uncharacterized membrane protein
MSLLVLGVLLWCAVHLMPAVARSARHTLVAGLGEQRYQGVFSLLIVAAIVLMVFGWRATPAVAVYQPTDLGHFAAGPLMLLAFFLFAASTLETNVVRLIRHPQLTAVILWAGAHLLANGDSRTLALFGTLGVWAVLEIILISRREGAWQRPAQAPVKAEVKPLLVAILVFLAVFALHPYLFGVSIGSE